MVDIIITIFISIMETNVNTIWIRANRTNEGNNIFRNMDIWTQTRWLRAMCSPLQNNDISYSFLWFCQRIQPSHYTHPQAQLYTWQPCSDYDKISSCVVDDALIDEGWWTNEWILGTLIVLFWSLKGNEMMIETRVHQSWCCDWWGRYGMMELMSSQRWWL